MFMSYQKKETVDVIKIGHDFTANDAIKIKGELDYIMKRGESKLMIDLSELNSIDTTAVKVLFDYAQKTNRRNGGLVLYNPHQKVLSVLKMTQFKNIFKIFFSSILAMQTLA